MSASDGGPAFPHHLYEQTNGMTLRDYFAAQAMPACISSFDRGRSPVGTDIKVDELIASVAYRCADAMLRERAK